MNCEKPNELDYDGGVKSVKVDEELEGLEIRPRGEGTEVVS
jgi:hypothetical protein